MSIRRADTTTEAGVLPGPELPSAMMKYDDAMMKADVFVDGVGLRPSADGARVRIASGTPTVVDGSFIETKELIAGFTMIRVKSREEAIEWVKRWPHEDGGVDLGIRQLFEAEDLGL